MRPRQWLKNGFVLAALIFSRSFTDPSLLGRALAALGGFCLLSSAVYLGNDVLDRDRDRRHPGRGLRPVARGSLRPAPALLAAAVLAAAALLLGFALDPGVGLVYAGYLVLMLLYCVLLKKLVLLDVLVIALGFLLRVQAGGLAVGVGISEWLYLCTFLLALFLALCKRRAELGEGEATFSRASLDHYSPAFLDQLITVVTAAVIVAYALYTLDGRTRLLVSPLMPLTIPFVIYGLFRYLFQVSRRGTGGRPEVALTADPFLAGDIVLWVAAVLGILFWGGRS